MPVTKSAKKALRQSKRRQVRNLAVKSAMKETVKEFRRAIEAKDSTKARELLSLIYQKLDKAAKRNVIHQNTAARKKSRLSRLAAKL